MKNTSSPKMLAKRERMYAALDLRKAGHTYDEIAQALGYADRSTAYQAVMAALKSLPAQTAEEMRKLDGERLDQLLAAVWPRAASGDPAGVDAALRILARRARLMGLDLPAKLSFEARGTVVILQLGQGRPPRIIDLEAPDLTALADDELDVLRALQSQADVPALPEPLG